MNTIYTSVCLYALLARTMAVLNETSDLGYGIVNQEHCEAFHANTTSQGPGWCNAAWDQILCWPPTPPAATTSLPCPPLKGVDPEQWSYRTCGADGQWLGRPPEYLPPGWTNYTLCFIPEIRDLMAKLYKTSQEDAKKKLRVAESGRILETVGLSISLAAILISLIIFSHFRALRNNRTRIHWHLFVAIKIQLVIRLTLYIDQAITRTGLNIGFKHVGIDNTPVLCEGFYVLLEYGRTAMFLWMFIEGMYLNNMVTLTVFHDKPNYRIYYLLGWGLPVLMTASWAVVTAYKYNHTVCWWGYSFTSFYWIIEGPRLAIILVNLMFLLNILRVLIMKLQDSLSSESQQIKKAVRAAIVLLPLLGITNSIQMIHSPLDRDLISFAAWTYITTMLTSFQGFFVALIYCFMNNEVRSALRKSLANYHSRRTIDEHHRNSLASYNLYRSATAPSLPLRKHSKASRSSRDSSC